MLLHAQCTASRQAGTRSSEGVTRQCQQQAFVRRLTLRSCQLELQYDTVNQQTPLAQRNRGSGGGSGGSGGGG